MDRLVLTMAAKNASPTNVESNFRKEAAAKAKDSGSIPDDILNDVNAAGSSFATQTRNYLRNVERQ